MSNARSIVVAHSTAHLKDLIRDTIQAEGFTCDLNYIDVSGITNMMDVFHNSTFNGDISKWDVSNVEDMSYMFFHAHFNGDISAWDTSKVKDMWALFHGSTFNGCISEWDVSQCRIFGGIFEKSNFSGDISNWNIQETANIDCFFSPEQIETFEKPTPYHWLCALHKKPFADRMPKMFRNHFDMYAPLTMSMASCDMECAKLLQKIWIQNHAHTSRIEPIPMTLNIDRIAWPS